MVLSHYKRMLGRIMSHIISMPVESLGSEGNQADRHRAEEQDTHQTMNNSCLVKKAQTAEGSPSYNGA